MTDAHPHHREIGEVLYANFRDRTIRFERIPGIYDYEKGPKSKCPVCGGLGFPWAGWFHCDDQEHVALIETGECFKILPEKEEVQP